MKYENLASDLIKNVGGKENVTSLIHCATRLRFTLNNIELAKTDVIKNMEGVFGVVNSGGQYQIIIGNNVADVYDVIIPMLNMQEQSNQIEHNSVKDSALNRFFKMIAGIMTPTIGVLAACGIIKGLLAACTSFNLLTVDSGTYIILYGIADSFFYFLPILVGYNASKTFHSNPFYGACIGCALVYPNIVALTNAGAALTFLGIPVTLMSYGNSIFPSIIGAWVAAKLDQFIAPKMHESIKNIITPLVVLLISVPLVFLAIGPIATALSNVLASAVQGIFNFSPIVCGLLLGAFWQVVVIFGLHYAFIPILMNNIATLGFDPVNAILDVTVFALAGVAIGYAIKAKSQKEKSLGISTGITGLFGVTEPIIYGIAMPHKKMFVYAFIGGGLAGAVCALMNGCMYAFGANALFAAPLFIDPVNGIGMSFYAYLASSAIAFFVPIILCLVLGVEEKQK